MHYSRETSVKELGGRALSMSSFILLLGRVSAELAIRRISLIYATARRVKIHLGKPVQASCKQIKATDIYICTVASFLENRLMYSSHRNTYFCQANENLLTM